MIAGTSNDSAFFTRAKARAPSVIGKIHDRCDKQMSGLLISFRNRKSKCHPEKVTAHQTSDREIPKTGELQHGWGKTHRNQPQCVKQTLTPSHSACRIEAGEHNESRILIVLAI